MPPSELTPRWRARFDRMEYELIDKDTRIARLEAQIASLRAELQKAKQTPPSTLPRSERAAARSIRRVLSRWYPEDYGQE